MVDPVAESGLEAPSIVTDDHGDVTIIRLLGEHDVQKANEIKIAIMRAALEGKGVVLSLGG